MVSSWSYMSVYISVCPCLCLSLCLFVWLSASLFDDHPYSRYYVQHMWLQAPGSNTLSGSIIFPSILPSSRSQEFWYFCICINFQFGGPMLQCIYPHTGVRRTPLWSSWYHMSVSLSLYPFVCVTFGQSKRVSHSCTYCMRPQTKGSNTHSGSITCPSIRMSGRPWDFCNVCIYINFQYGGPASQYIYPPTGVQRKSMG